MKPQKTNSQGLYLPKRNNRWKWMAGATAATAAGVTASQANTITINLVNNYISGQGGNHLNPDLTGDGHPDVTVANPTFYYRSRMPTSYGHYRYRKSWAGVLLNGVFASGLFRQTAVAGTMWLGSRVVVAYAGSLGRTLTGAIPIFFKDLHINGGAPTEGFLEVTVHAFPAEVQLDSFTYNTPTSAQGPRLTVPDQGSSRAVPDQGSSLGLLAIGAAGILALRRSRSAQADFQC